MNKTEERQATIYWKRANWRGASSVNQLIAFHLDLIAHMGQQGGVSPIRYNKQVEGGYTRPAIRNLLRWGVVKNSGVMDEFWHDKRLVSAPIYQLTNSAPDYVALLMDLREMFNA